VKVRFAQFYSGSCSIALTYKTVILEFTHVLGVCQWRSIFSN